MKTMVSGPNALAFEQRADESSKAFAAFRTYLELGPQRSLAAAAVRVGKSKVMMEKWSRRHDWCGRVAAHAAHLAMIEREAIEGLAIQRGVEWHRVHEAVRIAEWQRSKKLIALADEMLSRWEKNKARCGTLEGIARVLELASKLARLAAGMPTEIKEVNTTLTATVDVDWEVAIRKAYGPKAGERAKGEGPRAEVVDVVEVEPASGRDGETATDVGAAARIGEPATEVKP